MNFLAHIYLAGSNDDCRIGSFIADGVKGKTIEKFNKDIQKGIILHRHVDVFTDTSPLVKSLILKLKPEYDRYSGIIIDIFFDHFLNIHWNKFSDIPLKVFVKDFYILILKNFFILPQRNRIILPFLIYNNWLESYGSFIGLEKRLMGMSRRVDYACRMDLAVKELKDNYITFENVFLQFFPKLITFYNEKANYFDLCSPIRFH
ncbi:MAG: ACP phosphodiesterase [Bacteroidales bacterium]|nr:ACP phosphodiesterase [Bacteroidales bacterium]